MAWKYLWSEPFRTRYAIAAYLLRDCNEVIEIGGYNTPIDMFLPSTQYVTVIDPLLNAPEPTRPGVEHFHISFHDWQNQPKTNNYGIAILGIELHFCEQDWQKLIELIKNSTRTVIETPITHPPSIEQLAVIEKRTGRKSKMKIAMDLSNNDFGDMTDSAPPSCLRTIHLL